MGLKLLVLGCAGYWADQWNCERADACLARSARDSSSQSPRHGRSIAACRSVRCRAARMRCSCGCGAHALPWCLARHVTQASTARS
eukprot:221134-Prymnesium_polylepis.1